MRSATSCVSRGALCAAALMSWVLGSSHASANDEAAHALAEKFSQAADDGAKAEEARKAEARAKEAAKKQAEAARRKAAADRRAADEAELQRSAKEEAEARRAADKARTEAELQREAEQARIEAERQAARAQAQQIAEEARKLQVEQDRRAEEARQAEAARLTREVEEKRLAEEKRAAEENHIAAEKAEAERKAAEARVAEQQRKAEESRVAELKRKAAEAEAQRIAEQARVAELKREAQAAEEKRKAEEAALAEQRRIAETTAAAQRAALEAQREAEAQRIAEKFRLAREAREHSKETRSSLGGPAPQPVEPSPLVEVQAGAKTTYPARVTVLLVMQPRRHGFANPKITANPVLCVGDDCYVSNGVGAQASPMRRAQALGPGNTIGRNAGTCRNQEKCVFRGVTLPAPLSTIQPVDLGFWHHERREIRTVEPDRTCDVGPGPLHCSEPVVTANYRAWVVPETVAEKAGVPVLEHALDAGLPVARSASAGAWQSTVQALPTR